MTRLLAGLAVLALPALASAQYRETPPNPDPWLPLLNVAPPVPRQLPLGPYEVVVWPLASNQVIVGPEFSDGVSSLVLVETVSPRFSVGGGSMSPQRSWYPTGSWGNTIHVTIPAPVPVLIPPVPSEPVVPRTNLERGQPVVAAVVPSGQVAGKLVVQFPAAAEVWVAGKKVHDDRVVERPQTSLALIAAEVHSSPPTEWALTSPMLKPGETHTFEVKGRWSAGGKTFEATRTVTVTAGDRTRLIVASGAEAK